MNMLFADCEIKSHRIWSIWKPVRIRFLKSHRIFRPSYNTFYEEININDTLRFLFLTISLLSCYFAYCIFVFLGKQKNDCHAFLAVEMKKSMMCEKNNQ